MASISSSAFYVHFCQALKKEFDPKQQKESIERFLSRKLGHCVIEDLLHSPGIVNHLESLIQVD